MHHDWASMTVTRFRFLRWGLCDRLWSNHQISLPEVPVSPVSLLQRALVILVRMQTSQFRSFGKWVYILCFLDATLKGRSGSESWEFSAAAGVSTISRFSVKSTSHSGIPVLQFPATSLLQCPVNSSWLRIVAGSKEIGQILRRRCRERSCGWTRWWSWMDQWDEVLDSAEGLIPVFGQTWFTTIGPLMCVTVLFAKLAKGQYTAGVSSSNCTGTKIWRSCT